jgi:hypothetical protein
MAHPHHTPRSPKSFQVIRHPSSFSFRAGLSLFCVSFLATASFVIADQPSEIDSSVKASIVNGLKAVEAIPRPSAWDRFRVFVWQYQTDAKQDAANYESVGLNAFHIDRGADQDPMVQWSIRQEWLYYIDHAAGKGVLHLTPRTGLDRLTSDGRLQPRPQSLITKSSLADLMQQMDNNLAVAARGPAAAIALDDEVSLAHFNSPYEVDASPESVALFREFLAARYGTIDALNDQWDTEYTNFDSVQPASFETVRGRIAGRPLGQWNLSQWVDWRTYMDSQFSAAIARLVEHGTHLAPTIPVGFVGGQQPSAFGGYDYSRISRAVQWIEAYDIGGTNELLVSLWHDNRKPIVQTFFATGDAAQDSWFLWYYWAHGNCGVIAWPDMAGKPWFSAGRVRSEIEALGETFRQIQDPKLAMLTQVETKRHCDPVALLYSHDSVQVGWAADALTHGKTWPRRSSSLDNQCSSAGKNRVAWSKLLEDCGIQARWISTDELEAGLLERLDTKVLILPRALALSDRSCDAVQQFAASGGAVVADYWTAIFDQHGKARTQDGQLRGQLDSMFGIQRDESAGYFDGSTVSEVDGEKYAQPLLERLPSGFGDATTLVPVERGTSRPQATSHTYLNASPVAYYDAAFRFGAGGAAWRNTVSEILAVAGVKPAVTVHRDGNPIAGVEVLRWVNGQQQWIVVVANPTRDAGINEAGATQSALTAGPLILKFANGHPGAVDVRTGDRIQAGEEIEIAFDPASANVLRLQGDAADKGDK